MTQTRNDPTSLDPSQPKHVHSYKYTLYNQLTTKTLHKKRLPLPSALQLTNITFDFRSKLRHNHETPKAHICYRNCSNNLNSNLCLIYFKVSQKTRKHH
ncbi:hypothetical protein Hanom_Chr04g00356101 [Helianthus anomalus]